MNKYDECEVISREPYWRKIKRELKWRIYMIRRYWRPRCEVWHRTEHFINGGSPKRYKVIIWRWFWWKREQIIEIS